MCIKFYYERCYSVGIDPLVWPTPFVVFYSIGLLKLIYKYYDRLEYEETLFPGTMHGEWECKNSVSDDTDPWLLNCSNLGSKLQRESQQPPPEWHSPEKVVWVCPAVKTPFSCLSRRFLDPQLQCIIQFFRLPLWAKISNRACGIPCGIIFIRDTALYVFIVIQWTMNESQWKHAVSRMKMPTVRDSASCDPGSVMTHSSLNHNENMQYPVWKYCRTRFCKLCI